MSDNSNVRFIRKDGRIIPIRGESGGGGGRQAPKAVAAHAPKAMSKAPRQRAAKAASGLSAGEQRTIGYANDAFGVSDFYYGSQAVKYGLRTFGEATSLLGKFKGAGAIGFGAALVGLAVESTRSLYGRFKDDRTSP